MKKMTSTRKKLIFGIVLTLVMTAVLWFSMMGRYLLYNMGITQLMLEDIDETAKFQGAIDTARGLTERYEEVYKSFYSLIQVKADLMAKALYKTVSAENGQDVRKVGRGCVVKIENGTMTIPDGARTGLKKFADRITGNRGTLIYDTSTINGLRKDILVYSHIKGPYYYAEIVNGNELYEHVTQYVGVNYVFEGMIYAYDMTPVLYCPDHENSRYFFCYPSDVIYDGTPFLGGAFTLGEETEGGIELQGLTGWGLKAAEDKSGIYSYITEDIDELGAKLIIFYPETDKMRQTLVESVAGIVAIVILCVVFIVYFTSAVKEMMYGVMTKEKKEKYSPLKLRIKAVSYGIVGILIVFCVSLFMKSLSNLYQEIWNLDRSMLTLEWRLSERIYEKEMEDLDRKSLHIEYGQRLAELLEKYPHLNEKENLKELSNTVGARYVMLYDTYGREVSTSSDFVGMELGPEDADQQNSTSDFRRILKGVPSIAHDAVRDEVTGWTLELIGVRTNDLTNGGYGVLILGMEPENKEFTDDEEVNSIMKSLASGDRLCFSLDPETTVIRYSEDEYVANCFDAETIGLMDYMVRDGFSDFAIINGKTYFCISDADNENGLLHYFCTPNELIFSKGIGYSLNCGIAFGIIFALLCLYLFRGYTEKEIEEVEKRGPMPFPEEEKPSGLFMRIRTFISHKAGIMTPVEKALMTLRVMLALLILQMVVDYLMRLGHSQGIFVLDYVLDGMWNKGINLFALTAIVILLCGMSLLMFFVRLVLGIVGNMLSSKGKTICKLVANMIGYVTIIVFLYYALSYLGVDTKAILASVGVMGLGLTMGARDLISDILSGISLIFEGEYQVGDIVSIDGYRGMVQEIGVRTTKLEGRGGNIKTLRNSDVKNVINLTKLNSWVPITIKVDVNYPLSDAEAILAETFPRIAQSCPEIISGPYYKGVLSVELGFAVLSIIAECREEDFHQVERTLIRDVLVALREKNVPVR